MEFRIYPGELFRIYLLKMKGIKSEHWNLWIAWSAIGVLVLTFLVIIFNLYIQNRNNFVLEVNDFLELSEQQYLDKLLEKDSRGTVSSRDDSTLWIIRENKEYICRYEREMDINANIYRAVYDIVPLNSWNINQLADIIYQKIADHCPPFVLIRTDSVGKLIDSYKFKIIGECWKDLQYEYTIPLGFLDKHQLKVYYTYPWQIFWELQSKALMVIFILLTLVAICMGLFVKLLRNARKKAENQELFVQALNHDLKAPVAALQMQMYRLKTCSVAPYSSEQEELYVQTMQQIGSILASADRVLQDSIDARGVRLDLQEVDLQELVKEQVAVVAEAGSDKKRIEIETFFELPHPVIWADAHHLSRVILNLLENAVKYSGESIHIRVTCREEGKFVQIRLEDNGFGIAKPELKRIFEKNYRSRPADHAGKIKGFGVGLSYVKMIVRAHRGTIGVESEAGKGTVFIINLRYGRKN